MRVVKDRKGGNSQWEKGGHEGSEGQERRKLTVGEGRT